MPELPEATPEAFGIALAIARRDRCGALVSVDDSAMILDRDGEMISLFDPRRREWRGGELGDAPQLVLSHSIATEIARLLAKDTRP